MTKLKKLKFSNTANNDKNVEKILECIKTHNPTIEKLTAIGTSQNLVNKFKSQLKRC